MYTLINITSRYNILIDKQGKIVNADAPEPENEELVTDIKKLLK
ncbi:MAG: hypothetical protein AB9833_07785 [Bacteroidales bacterium]